MFDIAWSEFMVVAVVALVVVGPKDLPALLRTVGKTIASLRRMAGDFQSQFNEAMREAELDDFKKEITGLKDGASKMMGPNPFQIARDELKNAMADKPKATPSALAGPAVASEAGVSASPEIAADIPSAFAPPAPEIAAVDEAPAPATSELGPTPPPFANGAALPDPAGADDAPRPTPSGATA